MFKVSEQLLIDIVKTLKVLEHSRIEHLDKVYKSETKARQIIRIIETNYLKK